MQDSISRFSLRFKDPATEALYSRHSDRSRAYFAQYMYSILATALVGIFVFNQFSKRDALISLRISVHVAALLIILVSARYFPRSTGYLGYIHLTVYFAVSALVPETT